MSAVAVDSFAHRFDQAGVGSSARAALLLLHGTGADEHDLIHLGQRLYPGAALLSPRGKVSEIGANRFFRRLREGVFDLDDMWMRAAELAEWISVARRHYAIADRPLVAVGYSNGANVAVAMMLRQPGVVAGAVLLRAMMPYEPPSGGDFRGLEVFFGWGREDALAPASDRARLREAFERGGARVSATLTDAGHTLTMPDILAAGEWIRDPSRGWNGA